MNTDATTIQPGNLRFFRHSSFAIRHSDRSFSLIELVGVLAVMAILASVLVPALIRKLDKIAGDQESASLKSFGDALQSSIMRWTPAHPTNHYIPSDTDWASTVAIELGVDIANVTTNSRRQPRFLLVDPALRIGNNTSGLPYNQTNWVSGSVVTNNAGVVVPPLSPRLLILSSIGRRLPTNIVNGVPSSANFNAIWDSNDAANALPATTFAWAGWPNSEDLKIQRVNLSPLFVRLVLTTNVSSSAYYSIDSTNMSDRYNVPSPGRDGFFIKNSVLTLYTQGRTNIDSQQILIRDFSFVYDQNVWRTSLTGGSFLAGSLDLGSIVDKYLDAPENTNAMYTLTNNGHGNTNVSIKQQSVVVSNMVAYMNAYNAWADAGFPNNSLRSTAIAVQANMKNAVQAQYQSGGNPDYLPYPTICPP